MRKIILVLLSVILLLITYAEGADRVCRITAEWNSWNTGNKD